MLSDVLYQFNAYTIKLKEKPILFCFFLTYKFTQGECICFAKQWFLFCFHFNTLFCFLMHKQYWDNFGPAPFTYETIVFYFRTFTQCHLLIHTK